jgi:hypothetical protein
MAQEIMVAGAIYEDVPSVRLPDSDGVFHPFTDTSDTTAVAADVAEGKLFHLADGALATGTASGGGGGGESADPKDVNFIDYDGTILYSYTKDEFLALTAMPPNPTHAGLVSQGWNWTLADAQEYVADYGIQTIGQMYVTDDGCTRLYVTLTDAILSIWIKFSHDSNPLSIDWGDGSAIETVDYDGVHTFPRAGDYCISVKSTTDRSYSILGSNSSLGTTASSNLIRSNANINLDMYINAAASALTHVEIGDNCNIGDFAFYNSVNLLDITIPHRVSSLGRRAFMYCDSLSAIVLPDGLYTINESLSNMCSAKVVSLPDTLTNKITFSSCYNLERVCLPRNVVTMVSTIVSCMSLRHIVIPEGVASLGNNALANAHAIDSITIPSTVTDMSGNYMFNNDYSLRELHFLPTTPPTASSDTFSRLSTGCIIYVPQGSISAYTSAANYPDPNTYTYVEE